jgi:hypothetical protein
MWPFNKINKEITKTEYKKEPNKWLHLFEGDLYEVEIIDRTPDNKYFKLYIHGPEGTGLKYTNIQWMLKEDFDNKYGEPVAIIGYNIREIKITTVYT